jgi:hypothetical protein
VFFVYTCREVCIIFASRQGAEVTSWHYKNQDFYILLILKDMFFIPNQQSTTYRAFGNGTHKVGLRVNVSVGRFMALKLSTGSGRVPTWEGIAAIDSERA